MNIDIITWLLAGTLAVIGINLWNIIVFISQIETIEQKAKTITPNQEQKVTNKTIKEIFIILKAILIKINKNPKYKLIEDNLKSIKVNIGLLEQEKYALEKTQSDHNRTPYEVNIVELAKLEFLILDDIGNFKKLKLPLLSEKNFYLVFFIFILVMLLLTLGIIS